MYLFFINRFWRSNARLVHSRFYWHYCFDQQHDTVRFLTSFSLFFSTLRLRQVKLMITGVIMIIKRFLCFQKFKFYGIKITRMWCRVHVLKKRGFIGRWKCSSCDVKLLLRASLYYNEFLFIIETFIKKRRTIYISAWNVIFSSLYRCLSRFEQNKRFDGP